MFPIFLNIILKLQRTVKKLISEFFFFKVCYQSVSWTTNRMIVYPNFPNKFPSPNFFSEVLQMHTRDSERMDKNIRPERRCLPYFSSTKPRKKNTVKTTKKKRRKYFISRKVTKVKLPNSSSHVWKKKEFISF